jgi:hypothetical protein
MLLHPSSVGLGIRTNVLLAYGMKSLHAPKVDLQETPTNESPPAPRLCQKCLYKYDFPAPPSGTPPPPSEKNHTHLCVTASSQAVPKMHVQM